MPRGGARPGAGRKPKSATTSATAAAALPDNVIPFESSGPRLSIGQALQNLRGPAPASAVGSTASSPATTDPQSAAAPAQGTIVERPGNRSFARIASPVLVGVAALAIQDSLRKKKPPLQSNDPDPEDIDDCERATEDAIVRGFGDMEVPWWAGMALAFGKLYMGMRIGAKPLEAQPAPTRPIPEAPAPPSPPGSPLGQAPRTDGEEPEKPEGFVLPRIKMQAAT